MHMLGSTSTIVTSFLTFSIDKTKESSQTLYLILTNKWNLSIIIRVTRERIMQNSNQILLVSKNDFYFIITSATETRLETFLPH